MREYERSDKRHYEKSAKAHVEPSGDKNELEQIPEYPVNEFTFTNISKNTIHEVVDEDDKKGASVPRTNLDSTV